MDPTVLMIVSHNQSTSCLDPITIHKVSFFTNGIDCTIRWLESETKLYNCIFSSESTFRMFGRVQIVIDGSPRPLMTWFLEYTKGLQSAFHDMCLDRTDLPMDLQRLTKKFL